MYSTGTTWLEGRKRLMFVAGQLADLEVSLRSRAKVTETKRGSLGDEVNDRILDVQKAGDRLQSGTFTCPVGPQQGYDGAIFDVKGHAV